MDDVVIDINAFIGRHPTCTLNLLSYTLCHKVCEVFGAWRDSLTSDADHTSQGALDDDTAGSRHMDN